MDSVWTDSGTDGIGDNVGPSEWATSSGRVSERRAALRRRVQSASNGDGQRSAESTAVLRMQRPASPLGRAEERVNRIALTDRRPLRLSVCG